MRKQPLLGMLILVTAIMATSCNKTPDEDTLPDAIFNATVSGAVNQVISFTLTENVVSGTEAVNGSHSTTTDMFSMGAMELTGAWQFGIFYNSDVFQTGTYDILELSGFSNPSQAQAGFSATSGSITITKADLFQGVGSGVGAADDYFVDGSFTMEMESSDVPPLVIQVSGTFTGINIKSN